MTPLTVKLFGKFDLSFDDLDDVVASFVEPITARFRDVVEHDRFIDGTKDVVEVRTDKKNQMTAIDSSTARMCMLIECVGEVANDIKSMQLQERCKCLASLLRCSLVTRRDIEICCESHSLWLILTNQWFCAPG